MISRDFGVWGDDMTDFTYSSWTAYSLLTGNASRFFDAAYGESSSNDDGALRDGDNDDSYDFLDAVRLNTGGDRGFFGNTSPFQLYVGTLDINGTVYPVFKDPTTASVVLYAQSDSELPNSINLRDIDVGAEFAFCFFAGTLIATACGETAVEDLRIGDEIATTDGRHVAVKWIGRQEVTNPGRVAMDTRFAPVRIAASALAPGVPHSDLTLSAHHGMIIDGLVVNASALVNGASIRFVPAQELPERFTYYHIETEAHDVITANGAASETFIDAADRQAFDNYQEYLDLYGADRIIPAMARPRVSSARLLPGAIKARLGLTDVDEVARRA